MRLHLFLCVSAHEGNSDCRVVLNLYRSFVESEIQLNLYYLFLEFLSFSIIEIGFRNLDATPGSIVNAVTPGLGNLAWGWLSCAPFI